MKRKDAIQVQWMRKECQGQNLIVKPMPVAGQNIHVLADHGKSIKVSPFTPHCEPMSVRLIDAAIQYGNLYDGKSYILAI